jgi:hypothetical protein
MRFRKTPKGERERVEDFTFAVLDALIEQRRKSGDRISASQTAKRKAFEAKLDQP